MSVKEFIATYLPFAKEAEEASGISAVFILAQAAIESGWGKSVEGNNFFGIKADSSWLGKKQLVTTTEYHSTHDVYYPHLLSIIKKGNKFRYRIKDWFRVYDSPADSFKDHAEFFFQNPRYAEALQHKDSPLRFAQEVSNAGYATDPLYYKLLEKVIRMIEKEIGNV